MTERMRGSRSRGDAPAREPRANRKVVGSKDSRGPVPDMPGAGSQAAICPCGGGCPACAAGAGDPPRGGPRPPVPAGGASPGHAGPGTRLDPGLRAEMEGFFGHDLDAVRLHTDAHAVDAAERLGARAYTWGTDIGFGERQYAPSTSAGRRLIVHELTHVVQQLANRTGTPGALEVEAERAERGAMPPRRPAARTFGAPALRLSPDRATGLHITVAKDGRASFTVTREAGPPITAPGSATGISPGVYEVKFDESIGKMVISQPGGPVVPESSKFNISLPLSAAKAHKLLIEAKTPIPMTVALGDVPKEGYGGGTVSPKQQIANLPQHIKDFLFTKGARRRLHPSEYLRILRIAEKLMTLTPAELAAYPARTTGTAWGWGAFEASIDAYLQQVERQRSAVEKREEAKRKLFGLDDVYKEYLLYLDLLKSSAGAAAVSAPQAGVPMSGVGVSLGMQPTINKARARLTARLKRYGFNSIDEFAAAIKAFVDAFRNEAALIGLEMLDRYEHTLLEEQKRYRKKGVTEALHGELKPARERYKEAAKIRDEHASSVVMSPDEMADQAYWSGKFRAKQAEGAGAIRARAGKKADPQPLLGSGDLPHEKVAMASSGAELRKVLLTYIADRLSDVEKTRRNLSKKPDLIFDLDVLMSATMRAQNLKQGSIYQQIIKNHLHDKSIGEAIVNAAIALFAIVAGLLSGGTGTVAVLGAVSAVGIGAYQALDEFRRYELKSAAHGAGLLSDDPSFAWVIVAVVGMGLDLAAASSTIKALRPAAQAFDKTGDLVRFEEEVMKLTQVEERVRRNVLAAAKAEAKARAAWKAVFRPTPGLRMVVIPGGEEFGKLVYAVYHSIRRGIIARRAADFGAWALTREARALIGDVSKLSPEDLTKLKSAFAKATVDADAILRHGKALGMTEEEIHASFATWSNSKNLGVDDVIKEMDARHVASKGGKRFAVRDPSGPRPGETGIQYERRVFKETPLEKASKTYRGWRGGTRGNFSTWFKSVKSRLGGDAAAVAKRGEETLGQSIGEFITKKGSPELKKLWAQKDAIREQLLKRIEDLRTKQLALPSKGGPEFKQLQRQIDGLTADVDEINAFDIGKVGARRPDQIELFPAEKRAIVTDITLRPYDPWHNFKTMFYRDVTREITGWTDVIGIEFRSAVEQVLLP